MAVIVALVMTSLLIITGMVLDFGLVRVDRQVDKSAADSAALAGAQFLRISGDGSPHPFRGVCGAVRYLAANDPRFAGISDASGSWRTGTGASAGANGCTDNTLRNRICKPTDQTSWARFVWTGTYQGTALQVLVQSGYVLSTGTDPLSGNTWNEESLPAAASDTNDSASGCDQIAVVVKQTRKPGFGSLATSADLVSSLRSVARVQVGPGGDAPAMLLLKRSGCPILSTGGSGGGSHVYVYGAVSSTGKTQPGTIHSDSDGTGCTGGSNQNIFLGRAANGVVAFAAPLSAANPTSPDPSKPGVITTLAAANGASSGVLSDGIGNVFGSGAVDPGGIAAAPKTAPTSRGLVTRKLVDDRYLPAIQGIVTASQSVWSLTPATATGYTVVNSCSPPANAVPAGTQNVFVNCPPTSGQKFQGPYTFPSSVTRVVFNGVVAPNGLVSIPSSAKVYIFGVTGGDAITLSNTTDTLSVNGASTNLSGGLCSNAQSASSTDKGVVVVKSGDIKQSNGTLRLCYTTMVMMGSDNNACLTNVPNEESTALTGGPTATPCTGVAGDGQLSQTGGNVDWTAPNNIDATSDSAGNPLPAAQAGWADTNGPEDLAFWDESYGNSSNLTYNMNGGGTFHVVGVYMVPNAEPFTIGGGSQQTLSNAQYVASTIALNGNGTQIAMTVDANAAVQLPTLLMVGLVR